MPFMWNLKLNINPSTLHPTNNTSEVIPGVPRWEHTLISQLGVPRGWVESWRRLRPGLDTPGNLNATKSKTAEEDHFWIGIYYSSIPES